MTIKERILERLESEDRLYRDVAEELKLHPEHSELESKYRAIADAFSASARIVTEEFAKEGEESTPIYIIEFRAKGGKWQIFDMDGDRSRERAESYIPSNQTAYPDCEFRVVKYQRVEE